MKNILTFKSLTFKLKPSSDESVELLRDENVLGSADPPRVVRNRTPSIRKKSNKLIYALGISAVVS